MSVSSYQLSLQNAIWVDVNSRFTLDNLPDRLTDSLSISNSSLFNLFNTSPGQRARTFQPEYGSLWMHFIHEPITDLTAAKMEIFMVDSIVKWEPRIQLDKQNTRITANTNLPGYEVQVAFNLPNIAGLQQIQFQLAL